MIGLYEFVSGPVILKRNNILTLICTGLLRLFNKTVNCLLLTIRLLIQSFYPFFLVLYLIEVLFSFVL